MIEPKPKILDPTDLADVSDSTSSQHGSSLPTSQKPGGGLSEIWLYPRALENELKGVVDLPEATIRQILAGAWEYTRCVIPVYTNWDRYLAFCRVVIVGSVAEFNGLLVDIVATDVILGYDLNELFDILFSGTPVRDAMARDYRTFLLTTAEKTSNRHHSELFRRYVDALAESPKTWFRIRDADALVRFSLAAALACNDIDTAAFWFTDDQLQILGEIGGTLYDAVAFYKHRAEGETNNTFAYAGGGTGGGGAASPLRAAAYRRAREVLWALDVAWAGSRRRLPVLNFLRPFGGPIHMMMGRYRFVEDGLTLGRPETEGVVAETGRHHKLWNRVGSAREPAAAGADASYRDAVRQSDRLLIDGLADLLRRQDVGMERCARCRYRASYGAERLGQFGGVELCEACREVWRIYIESLPHRAAAAFPELRTTQLRLSC